MTNNSNNNNNNNKISILMLGTPKQPETLHVKIGNATIDVTEKIPYEDLLLATQWCVDLITGDRTFISEPIKFMIQQLAIFKFYTNLDIDNLFDDKDFSVERLYENFDILLGHDAYSIVVSRIDKDQFNIFLTLIDKTLDSIIAYKNSALGIVDMVSEKSKTNSADIQKALNYLNGKEGMDNALKVITTAAGIDLVPTETPNAAPALEDNTSEEKV